MLCTHQRCFSGLVQCSRHICTLYIILIVQLDSFLPLLMLTLIYLCSSLCRRLILIPLITAASIYLTFQREINMPLLAKGLLHHVSMCDVNIWLLLLCLMLFPHCFSNCRRIPMETISSCPICNIQVLTVELEW